MIKMTAKDEGDAIRMECEIKGKGIEIVEEAFAIVTDMPKRLEEISPAIYHAFMYKMAAEAMDFDLEDDDLTREVSDELN